MFYVTDGVCVAITSGLRVTALRTHCTKTAQTLSSSGLTHARRTRRVTNITLDVTGVLLATHGEQRTGYSTRLPVLHRKQSIGEETTQTTSVSGNSVTRICGYIMACNSSPSFSGVLRRARGGAVNSYQVPSLC